MNSKNSITNNQNMKVCKRKIKNDQKIKNASESPLGRNESHQETKAEEIDIDSMMKISPANEIQRRVQKRILQ